MRISDLRMRGLIAPAILAVGLLGATAAGAQGVIIDEGGVRVVPPGYDRAPPPPPQRWGDDRGPGYGAYGRYDDRGIGPRQARRIARSVGLVDTYGVDRRGPVWVVEGADRRGRGLRVVISARSGDIVNVDRDRRG